MLVESMIALPLLSAGLPPMLVHNLLLLGVIAASGIGMFVLARHLWGSTPAAIVAGLIFAFAPYRFSHFMHMELQWAVWMPWAFWALQRTLDTGSLRYGLLTGVFMALQLMSSIYYGLFLAVILATVGAVQVIAMGRRAVRAIAVLAAGAAILAITAWVYSTPYRQASARVGVRTTEEMRRYSAVPSSYFRVPETNRVLGRWRSGSTELSLYPGIVPVALGLIALVAMRPTRITLAYARAWRWRPTSRSASTVSSIRISSTMSRSSRAFAPRRARRFCSCCAWPSSRPAPRRQSSRESQGKASRSAQWRSRP